MALIDEKYLTALKLTVDPGGVLSMNLRPELRFAYSSRNHEDVTRMSAILENIGAQSLMTATEPSAQVSSDSSTVSPLDYGDGCKGILDQTISVADGYGFRYAFASVPGTGGFVAAEKVTRLDGSTKWHRFTGNEMGILLAHHIFIEYKKIYASSEQLAKLTMLSTVVSSSMLATMAKADGFKHVETLSGFECMRDVAHDLEEQGYDVKFAYEGMEYMLPNVSKNEDGVATAVLFLSAAAHWLQEDTTTPYEKLQQLYAKHGYHGHASTILVSPSPTITKGAFDAIRTSDTSRPAPHSFPRRVGHRRVTYWRDLTLGYESHRSPDHVPLLPINSSVQMLTGEAERRVRFTIWAPEAGDRVEFFVEGRDPGAMKEAQMRANQVMSWVTFIWFGERKWGFKEALKDK